MIIKYVSILAFYFILILSVEDVKGNGMLLIILHENKLVKLVTSLKNMVVFKLCSKTHKTVVLDIAFGVRGNLIPFENIMKAMNTLARKNEQ